jgi:hypothetical protein
MSAQCLVEFSASFCVVASSSVTTSAIRVRMAVGVRQARSTSVYQVASERSQDRDGSAAAHSPEGGEVAGSKATPERRVEIFLRAALSHFKTPSNEDFQFNRSHLTRRRFVADVRRLQRQEE